jgi:hypothetical protein
MIMNIGSILRAAAARVRQGWCQYRLGDAADRVCAIGAISCVVDKVASSFGEKLDAELDASFVLYDALHIGSVVLWNDREGQTQEGVAQGLERAAAWWDAQQIAKTGEAAPNVEWTHRTTEIVGVS